MAAQETALLCRLEAIVGEAQECPEDACPFWEPGRAALPGRCALEKVGVVASPALADWLLEIRERLAAADSTDADPAMRCVFHQLLNDSTE